MWKIAAAAALSCVVAVPVSAQEDPSGMSTEQKFAELYQISYQLQLIDAARAGAAEMGFERNSMRAGSAESVSASTAMIQRAIALIGSLDLSAHGVSVDSFSLSVGFASITLRVTPATTNEQ